MINSKRLVDEFTKYISISSESKNEKEFATFIKQELDALGFETKFDNSMSETGSNVGNLIAKLKGTKGNPILFSCHMDTVTPGVNIKPIVEDGIIKSDGTTILGGDDKAGIAGIIEAVKVLKENNIEHSDIEIAFSVCEEIGLLGAKALDYSQYSAKDAFVLDSGGTPGQVIVKGPAQSKINFTVKGKSAHAGVCPENGISAIMVAADAIANMKLLRIDEETTANIGKIVGGTVTNIVADSVVVTSEARSLNAEKLKNQVNHMIECFENSAKKYGASVQIENNAMYPSFVVEPDAEIVKNVFDACKNIGIDGFVASSGGGSDTNIINKTNGKTSVNLGIGEKQPHSLQEHMYVKDLENTSRLVLELMKLYASK